MRTWALRLGLACLAVAVVAGGYAVLNWTSLSARYAAYQFETAQTEAARLESVLRLLALGEAGGSYLVAPFVTGDEPKCQAVVEAVQDHLATIPPTEALYAACLRPFLDAHRSFSPIGAEAALGLVPLVAKCPGADARPWVQAGLTAPSAAGRARAARLALLPGVRLLAETVPLLHDPEAIVRRAALLAVGPATDDSDVVVEDEVLFPWLHDPDGEVRELCAAALRSRGLTDDQVALAARLASPHPADRLQLLLDLRSANGAVRDPGPWLERLSRDPDPAVRAGAVRVCFETRLALTEWANHLAAADPDPTVRRLAEYYRGLASAIGQTSHSDSPAK